MGWWDPGIMGGDIAYDTAGELAELLDIDQMAADKPRLHRPEHWSIDEQAFVRTRIHAYGVTALRERLLGKFENDLGDLVIANQVLGLILISCGADMPDDIRVSIVAACTMDSWACSDSRREAVITAFRKQIETYKPGTPVTIPQAGLLDRLTADHDPKPPLLLNWRRNPQDGSMPLSEIKLGEYYLIAAHDHKDEFDQSAGFVWCYEIATATEYGWHTDDGFFIDDAVYYVPCSELSPGDPNATP